MEELFDDDAGGDEYEQQLIKPKEVHPRTEELMDAVARATDSITKKVAMEIRNFNSPPHQDIKEVILCVANFCEGGRKIQHTWNTARQKLYEMVNRGVGSREKVTDSQLATLVTFLKSGITAETVKSKSLAVSYFITYLHAIHEL